MTRFRVAAALVLWSAGMVLVACGTPQSAVRQDAGVPASGSTAEAGSLQIDVPTTREATEPQLFVHVMPWFQAPPVADGFGFHWHMGGTAFDPFQTTEDGRARIASHYYPLTGPYDSSDPNLLEYQVALMKLAGIDGVIIDWYGNVNALDYAPINAASAALIETVERAGLSFAICYEDQSVGKLVEGGVITRDEALATGVAEIASLQTWFDSPSYLHHNGHPVLLDFGPQYFVDPRQWAELLGAVEPKPLFVTLDGHSQSIADGSFAWPPMWASTNGVLSEGRLVGYLNEYYRLQRAKPYLVTTAFPGFHDIYSEAGSGPSYGFLDDRDGATFALTMQAAIDARANVIQIATWNDYGEGTMIEPTIERGYRDLEYVQNVVHGFRRAFPFSRLDLRIPLELYRLVADPATAPERAAKAQDAFAALFADDLGAFRLAVRAAGVVTGETSRPILASAAGGGAQGSQESYDPQGRRNLALGRPISASSHIYDFVATNAADGITSTYWEGGANTYPNTLTVDLGAAVPVATIVVKLNPSRVWGAREQEIVVRGAADAAAEAYDELAGSKRYRFDPVANANSVAITLDATTRFVRLVFTANNGATAGQAAEVEIYGP